MIAAAVRAGCVVTIAVCKALLELTDPRSHTDDPLGQAPREPFEGYTMHGDDEPAAPCQWCGRDECGARCGWMSGTTRGAR